MVMHPTRTSIGIADLARRLKLSKSTVSRALNNYEDISPATKARVRDLANALGYVPSITAQRLAKGQTNTIGFVLPFREDLHSSPFLSEFLISLTDGLSSKGLDLVVHGSRYDQDPVDGYRRLLQARKVDGFVLIRTQGRDARIRYLLEQGIPFITHGRSQWSDEHAWYDVDSSTAFERATRFLLDQGHRQLAFIGYFDELNSAHLRLEGFRQALKKAGMNSQRVPVISGSLTEQSGFDGAMNLLQAHPETTAILCVNDATAFGVIRAARALNRRVPDDLSVIGYDNVSYASVSDPPLTTLNNPVDAAGKIIAESIHGLLQGDAPGRHQTLVQASLVQRSTVKPHAVD